MLIPLLCVSPAAEVLTILIFCSPWFFGSVLCRKMLIVRKNLYKKLCILQSGLLFSPNFCRHEKTELLKMKSNLKIIGVHFLMTILLGLIYLYFSEDITILLFTRGYSEVQWSMVILSGFSIILICCFISTILSIQRKKNAL